MLTGPGLPHNWISQTNPGEQIEVRDKVIQFRQDMVASMASVCSELRPLLPMLDRAGHGIHFRGTSLTQSEPWFDEIQAARGPSRISLLLQFLEFLSDQPDQESLSTLPMRVSSDADGLDKVERAISHMSEQYDQNVLLADVATLVGMSESAFSRLFARATGNNFTRFLNRIRVARACELLSSTNDPITEICYQVGYNNVANFNRRFRELKGLTPREYRRLTKLHHANAVTPDKQAENVA